jgi:hypothetical protein
MKFYRIVDIIVHNFWYVLGRLGVRHVQIDPPFVVVINGSSELVYSYHLAHDLIEDAAHNNNGDQPFQGEFYSSERAYRGGERPDVYNGDGAWHCAA